MNDMFEVKFEFPSSHGGYYDDEECIGYVFGKNIRPMKELIPTLNHETLHWVLQKMVGKKARKIDNIAKKVLKWDKKAYRLLY